ncbi:hypothetical protein U0070_016557 [Myodes glareolus]|uniref:Phosphatidylserine Lipase ABHD16 N-terminal domain-containing protein n=1 Tax=Myodes glareolus TaxID=447135 RepID=A0AAW0H2X4_MYOGA
MNRYLSLSKVVPFSHYAGTLLLLLAGVACLRGIGRWTNPQYRQFITILEATHRNQSAENKVRVLLPHLPELQAPASAGSLPHTAVSFLSASWIVG